MAHWTEGSTDDFLYRITADLIDQLEEKIQSKSLSKAELAKKLGLSKGRVSQILNNPGNLGLKTIIRFARALGLKIAIVAYDDRDESNERGPINSEIFRICWENSGKPANFWSLEEPQCVATNTASCPVFFDAQIMNIVPTQSNQSLSAPIWSNLISKLPHGKMVTSSAEQSPKNWFFGQLVNIGEEKEMATATSPS
jgi:transcriptional regulator with XRE-family HTH domain